MSVICVCLIVIKEKKSYTFLIQQRALWLNSILFKSTLFIHAQVQCRLSESQNPQVNSSGSKNNLQEEDTLRRSRLGPGAKGAPADGWRSSTHICY